VIKINDHKYSFRLTKEEYIAFSKVCKFTKMSRSDALRALMNYFVQAYIDSEENRDKEKCKCKKK